MKATFDHIFISSFKEWFSNRLLEKGECFQNNTFPLYPVTNDPRLSANYDIYAASAYQWVYNSSITGADIPNYISHDGGTINRGEDDMRIDFKNGRVLFPKGTNDDLTGVSIDASLNEINIYTTTLPDEKIVFEMRDDRLPDLVDSQQPEEADLTMAPCVFLKVVKTANDPFCLGGSDLTYFKIRAICFCNSEYQLTGLFSIFRDSEMCFRLLNNTPLNYFNDIKDIFGGEWSYTDDSNFELLEPKIHIEEVDCMPVEIDNLNKNMPELHLGFIEFKVFMERLPRKV